MTAVQGIPFVSPHETERLPDKDVKSKGEISPFEKLLTREKVEDMPNSEDSGTKSLDVSEKLFLFQEKAGPGHPVFYSTEKLTSLLKGTVSTKELSGESTLDNTSFKELSLNHINSNQELMIPANQWDTEIMTENPSGNLKKIMALLLSGDIGSEELARLLATDQGVEQNSEKKIDSLLRGFKERILSPEEQSDKSLKAILTEEGELIYFDEKILGEGEKSLKGLKDAPQKGMNLSGNKLVMEINVTDLRDGKGQPTAQLVSTQEQSAIKASLEGKAEDLVDSDLSNDLLGTPAEKLFSPEGGGGKLEAPVAKEVSRLFQDYMKDTGSRDLVKKIDFILRNDNQGEIKLILKPESLGNVRINLSLSENHIAGKIFVDNSSVRDIFLNNMNQIINQLKANGYAGASLEVWVGQEGQSGQKGRQESEEDRAYRMAERIKRFDQSVPYTAPGSYVNEGEVNLVI